jgi:hypothetical protein
MPSILSKIPGAPGLGSVGSGLPINAPQPKTFVPPTGLNTGTPGRPPSVTGQGGGQGGGGAPGTLSAPPNIAAITDPQALLQAQPAAGQQPQPGAPTGVLPIYGAPGQLSYNPLTGTWTLPDGTTRPGGE